MIVNNTGVVHECESEKEEKKAKKLNKDLKILLRKANEASIQKVKFYENLLGQNRSNLKLSRSVRNLKKSQTSRTKLD